MVSKPALIEELVVEPGTKARLDRRDTDSPLGLRDKAQGERLLAELTTELALLHNRLWAEAQRSLLLVLQGADASGKDGSIRAVLTGVNPQGGSVRNFV